MEWFDLEQGLLTDDTRLLSQQELLKKASDMLLAAPLSSHSASLFAASAIRALSDRSHSYRFPLASLAHTNVCARGEAVSCGGFQPRKGRERSRTGHGEARRRGGTLRWTAKKHEAAARPNDRTRRGEFNSACSRIVLIIVFTSLGPDPWNGPFSEVEKGDCSCGPGWCAICLPLCP